MAEQYLLLQRNQVYGGITRGKKLVVLIGQRKALARADAGKVGARQPSWWRSATPGCTNALPNLANSAIPLLMPSGTTTCRAESESTP